MLHEHSHSPRPGYRMVIVYEPREPPLTVPRMRFLLGICTFSFLLIFHLKEWDASVGPDAVRAHHDYFHSALIEEDIKKKRWSLTHFLMQSFES